MRAGRAALFESGASAVRTTPNAIYRAWPILRPGLGRRTDLGWDKGMFLAAVSGTSVTPLSDLGGRGTSFVFEHIEKCCEHCVRLPPLPRLEVARQQFTQGSVRRAY